MLRWPQLEEAGDALAVGGVVGLGVGHGFAQVVQHGGQVGLELLPRLPELLDFGQFVVEKAADEPVQVGGAGHIHPHRLFAVLEEDGG